MVPTALRVRVLLQGMALALVPAQVAPVPALAPRVSEAPGAAQLRPTAEDHLNRCRCWYPSLPTNENTRNDATRSSCYY